MLREYLDRLLRLCAHIGLYIRALIKWLLLAAVTGCCCGVVGTLFHIGVERATELRGEHPWLLWCLPVAGLAIVALYKLTKTEGQGTNDIIDEVHLGTGLRIWLLPTIFFSTVLTHLCGGSAGREGAALQMGGTIGYQVGHLFGMDDRDMRTATMTGMAAFFAALFGTPLTATVFAIVVISIGVMYHAALIPCLTASLVAYWISVEMGVEPTRFVVEAPALEGWTLLRVAVLGAGCALVSVLFCGAVHGAEHQLRRRIPNPWLRAVAGGRRHHRPDLPLRHCGLQRRRNGGHHRSCGAGHRPSGSLPVEDPVYRSYPGRWLQGRRGGAFLFCGSDLWVRGRAAAGTACGLFRGAGSGGGVLRGGELPYGLHYFVGGAVRGWGTVVLCPDLRRQLHALRLQRPPTPSQTILYSKLKAKYINVTTKRPPRR